MADVEVRRSGDGRWHAVVREGASTTEHEVTVPSALATRLGVEASEEAAVETLLRASFEFLLEREPASAILPSFSLDVIGRYFPEYESEIGDRLG